MKLLDLQADPEEGLQCLQDFIDAKARWMLPSQEIEENHRSSRFRTALSADRSHSLHHSDIYQSGKAQPLPITL